MRLARALQPRSTMRPIVLSVLLVLAAAPASGAPVESGSLRAWQVRPREGGVRIDLRPIRFAPDSYRVDAWTLQTIRRIAAHLARHPEVVVYVLGYTDERGNARANWALGVRRCNAVVANLERFGVRPDHIGVVSYGERRPLTSRHDEKSWGKERRVELVAVREGAR
jgi:peptidoglycan-associated lipoprotein